MRAICLAAALAVSCQLSAVSLLGISPAAAHDWYSDLRNGEGALCCGGRDCAPLGFYELHVGDGEFEIEIGGLRLAIPESRVLRDAAPDGRPHVCVGHLNGQPVIRCLILPPVI